MVTNYQYIQPTLVFLSVTFFNKVNIDTTIITRTLNHVVTNKYTKLPHVCSNNICETSD